MRTLIMATAIVNGKVVGNGMQSFWVADAATTTDIGHCVVQAMNDARAFGYHMADPNMFIRVDLKEHD